MPPKLLSSALCATILLLACALPAHAGKRVALLIGNARYASAPLNSPPADLKAMESALVAVGFKVEKVADADQKQMKRAVRDFGVMAKDAEVALLYYSGHATQVNGENWLVPLKASIDKEADYELEAVAANALLAQIREARPKAGVVVLDACRTNPFAATKGGPKGMALMGAPSGTMIAFATAPGRTAADEGHYARALAAQITKPGLELFEVFRGAMAEVMRLSRGEQEPRVSEWSIKEHIYLAGNAPVGLAGRKAPVVPASPAPSPAVAAVPGTTFRDCADCPEMVWLPPGSFKMGSNGGAADERPMHTVQISYPLAVGRVEVTRGQWGQFVRESGRVGGGSCWGWQDGKLEDQKGKGWRDPGFEQNDRHPVACVSWEDAQAFVKWLGKKTGKGYRLLSEAEWEYAARGGSSAERPWEADSAVQCRYANGVDRSLKKLKSHEFRTSAACDDDYPFTAPAGSFEGNGFGLHDMLGNVWEWTADCYESNYQDAPKDGSAFVAGKCDERSARGGSWINSPVILRAAIRIKSDPAYRLDNIGLRIARIAP